MDEDYEVGDECNEKVETEEFGRRAVMAARQTLVSRIMELEKDEIYKRYEDRIGDLITGEIHQVLGKEVLVLDDATGQEIVLPKSEMIRGDFSAKENLLEVSLKVEMRNNLPVITLSRTEPLFLERLMEQEVPEIEDGLITIKKIVRIPGEGLKLLSNHTMIVSTL
jgi:N utilization substance protein A